MPPVPKPVGGSGSTSKCRARGREAIDRAGVLKSFPTTDLATQKVGVFGKLIKLNAALKPGDRVEIYRSITRDPQTVPRRDGAGRDEVE